MDIEGVRAGEIIDEEVKNMSKKFVDIYSMTNDTNFGPHHDGELLTLACCMVKIRKKVGELWEKISNPMNNLEYWVVGRVASSLDSNKKNHLIYFMKVEDVMNFAEYSENYGLRGNGRKDNNYTFKKKKEDPFDPDNYEEIDENIKGHSPEHDIGKGKYVLLSEDYCYFDWRNNPYKEKLGEWDIPELEWVAPGKNGPFRRKFDFDGTEKIIAKLKKIKEESCHRYIPEGNGCGGCRNS